MYAPFERERRQSPSGAGTGGARCLVGDGPGHAAGWPMASDLRALARQLRGRVDGWVRLGGGLIVELWVGEEACDFLRAFFRAVGGIAGPLPGVPVGCLGGVGGERDAVFKWSAVPLASGGSEVMQLAGGAVGVELGRDGRGALHGGETASVAAAPFRDPAGRWGIGCAGGARG